MPSPSRNPSLRSELRPVTQPDGSRGFGHRLVRLRQDSDTVHLLLPLDSDGELAETIDQAPDMPVYADRVAAAEERIRMMNAASAYRRAAPTLIESPMRPAAVPGAGWIQPAPLAR